MDTFEELSPKDSKYPKTGYVWGPILRAVNMVLNRYFMFEYLNIWGKGLFKAVQEGIRLLEQPALKSMGDLEAATVHWATAGISPMRTPAMDPL